MWEPGAEEPVPSATVAEAVMKAARTWPEATALVDGGDTTQRWTFASLYAEARRAARAVASCFAPGEHVAVWSSNRPEWIVLEFAAALAGVTLVTVNPAFGPGEVAFVLSRSEAAGVFIEPAYRGKDLRSILAEVSGELPALRMVVGFEEWDDFAGRQADAGSRPLPGPLDIAQIQYTSGTTGFPKGAQLTQRGLAANGYLYASAIDARPGDVWVNPMPLFHTAGCGLATLGALQTGGTQVLVRSFDPDVVLDLLEGERGTVSLMAPTMLIRVLDAQAARPRDVSAWRLVTLGGTPVPPDLLRRAEREAGVQTAIGFGQTEASPYITHTRPRDPNPAWAETVGQPMPNIAVRIVDPATNRTVPAGVAGEICARSICVMPGYYNDPDATSAVIDADGWLHTGDLGTMDEQGYVRVSGRLKDMIIRGGENIYPREIEHVLFEHPAVADVSVVGVPDPEWGETVAAFVRCSRPVTPEELREFCQARIASFKVPRIWRFVAEFPQTASGKIQKYALREQLAAEMLSADGPPGRGQARVKGGGDAFEPRAGGDDAARAG